MAVGDIYRLAAIGVGRQNQQLVNVWHYKQLDPTIIISAGEGLTAAWVDQVQAAFLKTFAGGAALQSLSVRGVSDPTYGFDLDIDGHPSGTGGSGDELPPMNAAVITWKTGLIGRSYRGRTFCWPISESSQAHGVCTSGYLADLQSFGDTAIVVSNVLLPQNGSWQMVIHSATHGVNTLVTQAVARPQIHLQRRRGANVGA